MAKTGWQLQFTDAWLQALHRFAGGGEERPHLLLEGFDAEQVWLQLDGQLKGAAQRGRKLLRKAGDVPHLLQPGMEDALQGGPGQHIIFVQLSGVQKQWCRCLHFNLHL